MADTLDMENRDPNNMNGHLSVLFEDVLAEPEGSHAIDCVWKNAYMCYTGGLSCCYKTMTVLCGLCLALYWGCVFACIACQNIWCITPCCKCYDLYCNIIKKLLNSILEAILGPCCVTCGLCLSRIEVTNK